jgi:hypothetical protein
MASYSGTQAYGLNPSSLDFSWGNPRGFESHSSHFWLFATAPFFSFWHPNRHLRRCGGGLEVGLAEELDVCAAGAAISNFLLAQGLFYCLPRR